MLTITNLSHRYAGGRLALDGVSLAVAADELVCIVGPSGCGKSTLLRCVAGLVTPTAGTIGLAGDPAPAMVFQDYGRSLFPWLSVRSNVDFPLRGRVPRAERRARAAEALRDVGLPDVADRYPWELSGGMQQRVAIARALVVRPALLLMDEPFASVDAQTRAGLEDLLLRVRRAHGVTVLLVTHDIDESVYLGDRIVVLSPGPGTVVADLPSGLPAERDQIGTRGSPAFAAARTAVAKLLMTGTEETP
ncbi:ABC transporter ATP-binding protein [Catenuloplanes atrovinosus]|uniref:NitT/TauT family transport system ATP-binding protein n=1 Tax=Catenuloplanes atrovinosus TaxID=137266 RepID=A0AAE4CB92_9ACTN|nr:ABC transporter ATP-binding protein [Catenuloplanes atrovinosus]MDR7275370.1 NitT/TauT family transport system ATP-binding protein [Catenuloplanes atrovinosus]